MQKGNAIKWSVPPILLILLGILFWHREDVGYVCAKTGSEMGYEEYFSLIRAGHYYNKSWVQRIAEEEYNFLREDHDWRKIRGTRTSRFSTIRAHDRAPAIYQMGWAALDNTHISYDLAVEGFRIHDPKEFVKIMLYGSEDDRKVALQGRNESITSHGR